MTFERSDIAPLNFTVENRLNFCCDLGARFDGYLTTSLARRNHERSLASAVGIDLE